MMPSEASSSGNGGPSIADCRIVSSNRITPLTCSARPGVVNSMSRYARRLASVESNPIESNRFLIVPVLSSAARMPLPGATSWAAVARRTSVSMFVPPVGSCERSSCTCSLRAGCARRHERPQVGQVGVGVTERTAGPAEDRPEAQAERASARERGLDPPIRGNRADGRDQRRVRLFVRLPALRRRARRRGCERVGVHAVQPARVERDVDGRALTPVPGVEGIEREPLPRGQVPEQIGRRPRSPADAGRGERARMGAASIRRPTSRWPRSRIVSASRFVGVGAGTPSSRVRDSVRLAGTADASRSGARSRSRRPPPGGTPARGRRCAGVQK